MAKKKQQQELISKNKAEKKKMYDINLSSQEMLNRDKIKIEEGIKKGKSNGSLKGKKMRVINKNTIIYARTINTLNTMQRDINK